ncbi:hypothetical protein MMC19_002765 [Ptychographa xylographoides]|nr:hypothetical protein [Ptychographa xylographoides]
MPSRNVDVHFEVSLDTNAEDQHRINWPRITMRILLWPEDEHEASQMSLIGIFCQPRPPAKPQFCIPYKRKAPRTNADWIIPDQLLGQVIGAPSPVRKIGFRMGQTRYLDSDILNSATGHGRLLSAVTRNPHVSKSNTGSDILSTFIDVLDIFNCQLSGTNVVLMNNLFEAANLHSNAVGLFPTRPIPLILETTNLPGPSIAHIILNPFRIETMHMPSHEWGPLEQWLRNFCNCQLWSGAEMSAESTDPHNNLPSRNPSLGVLEANILDHDRLSGFKI